LWNLPFESIFYKSNIIKQLQLQNLQFYQIFSKKLLLFWDCKGIEFYQNVKERFLKKDII